MIQASLINIRISQIEKFLLKKLIVFHTLNEYWLYPTTSDSDSPSARLPFEEYVLLEMEEVQ